jgi:DNA-binding transcriptional LysR family regulator
VCALVPASVALDLPDGIAAVPITDPPERLETALVWRSEEPSPVNRAFRTVAEGVFRDEAV